MKKIIMILLFITILVLIYLYKYINISYDTMTIYQASTSIENIEDSATLQKDNLNVKLLNFYLNGNIPNNMSNVIENEKRDTNCVQRVEFSTQSGNPIQSVIFDYLIYDNNGNILSTNIYGDYPQKEELYLVKSYLNKHIFNSTDNTSYMNRILNSSYAFERIQNLEETISKNLTMSVIGFKRDNEKYEDNFNKIHILIINPKYQEYGNSDFTKVSNTIFEFILTK